jgi:hypothetical protein
MSETRTCSTCNKTHTIDNFEKNCRDEWFKLCNKCRSNGRKDKNKSRDKIMGAFIPCNICGQNFRKATIPNHQRTYLCQPQVKGKGKIDYYTWLFQNEATLLPNPQEQLKTFRTENRKVFFNLYKDSCAISHADYETYSNDPNHEAGENEYFKFIRRLK